MFQSDEQRAAAYAAFKFLERMLKEDGNLPSGFYMDVSGRTVEIKFPNGTVVERDAGTNGDGSMFKKATQNLYGWAVIAKLARRLKSFNQWDRIRREIVEAVRDALSNGTGTEIALTDVDQQLAAEIQSVRDEVNVAPRKEQTPRVCKDPGVPATITFRKSK